MTLWMGQDGYDYCFQADYKKIWDDAVSAVREIAEYAPDVDISIEYKPNEPRAYSIFPNATTCLLAVEEAGARTWVSRSILLMCCLLMRSGLRSRDGRSPFTPAGA
jgi:L-rhamnose isomerase